MSMMPSMSDSSDVDVNNEARLSTSGCGPHPVDPVHLPLRGSPNDPIPIPLLKSEAVPASAYEAVQCTAQLSSVGATLHASGHCRPCGWFWKPQGCVNGRDCLHCHECPPLRLKEIRRIKKMRKRGEEAKEDMDGRAQPGIRTSTSPSVSRRLPTAPH